MEFRSGGTSSESLVRHSQWMGDSATVGAAIAAAADPLPSNRLRDQTGVELIRPPDPRPESP